MEQETFDRRMAAEESSDGLDVTTCFVALMQIPETLYKTWEDHVPQTANDALTKASESTGIAKKYLLWMILTTLFYLMTGRASEIFYRLVASVYPGYMSFKALESSNKERSTRWLKYWVIHAAVEFVSFFTPTFVSRVASLSVIKSIFIVWCILPIQPSGTDVVYGRVMSRYYEPLKQWLETVFPIKSSSDTE